MASDNWNYPPGADADPRAPWHQVDADDCPACDGTGKVACDATQANLDLCCDGRDDCCDGQHDCEDCNGEGTVPEPEPYERDWDD